MTFSFQMYSAFKNKVSFGMQLFQEHTPPVFLAIVLLKSNHAGGIFSFLPHLQVKSLRGGQAQTGVRVSCRPKAFLSRLGFRKRGYRLLPNMRVSQVGSASVRLQPLQGFSYLLYNDLRSMSLTGWLYRHIYIF